MFSLIRTQTDLPAKPAQPDLVINELIREWVGGGGGGLDANIISISLIKANSPNNNRNSYMSTSAPLNQAHNILYGGSNYQAKQFWTCLRGEPTSRSTLVN